MHRKVLMSIKSKIAAAAAALTLVSGIGAAGALTAGSASAATPSCGKNCLDLFSKQFGTFTNPQFVVDVYRQGEKSGQPIILFRDSNSDPAEDWTLAYEGTVADFYSANMVSSAFALHYGCTVGSGIHQFADCSAARNLFAFESEYAPFGVDSGLCSGVASVAFQGEGVTLQPCGVSANTVWAADTLDSCPFNPLYSLELPLINGSDTNFSHPFVLTYPASAYPTDKPRPELTVTNLTGFSQTGGSSTGPTSTCGGSAVTGPDSSQLWSAKLGVLN